MSEEIKYISANAARELRKAVIDHQVAELKKLVAEFQEDVDWHDQAAMNAVVATDRARHRLEGARSRVHVKTYEEMVAVLEDMAT